MLYVKSVTQLDDLSNKLSKHLKAPLTRIRSAIAKAEGFEHISAFKEASSKKNSCSDSQCGISLDVQETSVLNELALWLEDNVDMSTEIFFDNDEAVDSKVVLAVVDKLLGKTNHVENEKVLSDVQEWLKGLLLEVEGTLVSPAGDSDSTAFENVHHGISSTALNLAMHPQAALSIALLESSGMGGFAHELKLLMEAGVTVSSSI